MEETIMLQTQLIHLQTLYEIMCESEEPDIIRKALAALTSTSAGIQYLEMNPITT
jgi:hypothetical protein